MKTLAFPCLIFILCALSACDPANKKADPNDPGINTTTPENPKSNKPLGTPDFRGDTMFDFGRINEGEKVFHNYKFKNVGSGDLMIAEVNATCGCTSTSWTKEVIPPGGEGFVKAEFDSKGKAARDPVSKHVTVTFSSSTVPIAILKFQATVVGETSTPE